MNTFSIDRKEKDRRKLRVMIRPRYSTRNRNPALLYAFLGFGTLEGSIR